MWSYSIFCMQVVGNAKCPLNCVLWIVWMDLTRTLIFWLMKKNRILRGKSAVITGLLKTEQATSTGFASWRDNFAALHSYYPLTAVFDQGQKERIMTTLNLVCRRSIDLWRLSASDIAGAGKNDTKLPIVDLEHVDCAEELLNLAPAANTLELNKALLSFFVGAFLTPLDCCSTMSSSQGNFRRKSNFQRGKGADRTALVFSLSNRRILQWSVQVRDCLSSCELLLFSWEKNRLPGLGVIWTYLGC